MEQPCRLSGRERAPRSHGPEQYLYGRTSLTVTAECGGGRALGTESDKRIIMRIDPNDESITPKDIMQRIPKIQRQNPDLDVFFDRDAYPACSRSEQHD